MSPLVGKPFLKMNGIGNEIVVLDLRGSNTHVSAAEARAVGAGPGLLFDQMMAMHDPRTPGTAAFVEIFNIDGSLAGACGNGTRCVAYALLRGSNATSVSIETAAGVLPSHRLGEWDFSVDMGVAHFDWRSIPLAHEEDTLALSMRLPGAAGLDDAGPVAISMGNPHAIFFVADASRYDLDVIGPAFEHDRLFPERANISLAEVLSPDHIRLHVWERGAGRTRACGTAACASVVAGVRRGLTQRRAIVTLPGGDLHIEWRAADSRVIMSGLTELEFEGYLSADLFKDISA